MWRTAIGSTRVEPEESPRNTSQPTANALWGLRNGQSWRRAPTRAVCLPGGVGSLIGQDDCRWESPDLGAPSPTPSRPCPVGAHLWAMLLRGSPTRGFLQGSRGDAPDLRASPTSRAPAKSAVYAVARPMRAI